MLCGLSLSVFPTVRCFEIMASGGGSLQRSHTQVATQLKMADLQDLRYIYMVGGFCASPLLQDATREEFDDPGRDLKVVVAPRPGLAVVSYVQQYSLYSWYIDST